MITIYVFSNELLGDDGTDFNRALVDFRECKSDIECFDWFDLKYDSNDYSCSFCKPE